MIILVIDDSPYLLEGIKLFLERHGFTVYTTESSNEAIDIVKDKKPEVVLLDYHVPGFAADSFVTIAHMEKPDICIILVSGVSDVTAKAKSLGLKYAIQKPFDPETLLKLIRKVASGGES